MLRAVPSPSLALATSGTVGPRRAVTALDRGYADYDSDLQASLYLCAGTGPAAGPCLAVLGGLFAVAGATSSLVYSAAQGETGRVATAHAKEAFAALPAITALPARIADAAAARAANADRVVLRTTEDCTAPLPDVNVDSVFDLDVVDMHLAFTPGYQFRLTLVARLVERACPGRDELRSQRLAYLGPMSSMSRDPTRASAAFTNALDAAVTALATDVDLYLQGKREILKP